MDLSLLSAFIMFHGVQTRTQPPFSPSSIGSRWEDELSGPMAAEKAPGEPLH